MKKISAILIGAGQRGKDAYATYALEFPNEIEFVAVADSDEERIEMFKKDHDLTAADCYVDWKELLSQDKMADVALICTQDNMHYEPTIMALEKGYDLLLEKPMSNDLKECVDIGVAAQKYESRITVCHVLRYTDFFTEIKKILDEGIIGEITTIQHEENVGYSHQAHSFVRGNWRNSKESSPMILAKSCHDMDILLWLAGSDCKTISSFGSLKHFKKECAPSGSPLRCLDGCPHKEDCVYYAPKIYMDGKGSWQSKILRSTISNDDSDEGIMKALESGPYGRCVYHCDNDVVDHQVVSMEFDNMVNVVFTMTAFTAEGGRNLRILGTKGQLSGFMEDGYIEIRLFGSNETKRINIASSIAGHGGGDFGIMKSFVSSLQEKTKESLSSAETSVQSHVMAFAAEESRLNNGKAIDIREFWGSYKT